MQEQIKPSQNPSVGKPEPSFAAITKSRLTNAIKRILDKSKVDFMILVLDDASEKLVYGLFSPVELSVLKFNIVHKLGDNSRNPRKYDALYLMQASQQSVLDLCKDFSNPRHPMYLDAHVLLLNGLQDQQLRLLKQEKSLLERLQTLEEIDIGFVPCLSNAFSLRMKGYFNQGETAEWKRLTVERLAAAILSYHPFAEMSIASSPKHQDTATQLSKFILERIAVLTKGNVKNCETKTPKIKVLLLDRQSDLQSPMMRDYNYLPLVCDVFEVSNNLLPIEKNKNHSLKPEFDAVWEATKELGIAEANETLERMALDIKGFAEKKTEEMDKIARLDEKVRIHEQLKVHLDLMNEINTKHGPALSLLTAMQQTVVNGVNDVGQKLKDSQIYQKVCELFKEERQLDEINYLRLVALCLMSLELKPAKCDSLMQSVKEVAFKDLPKKIVKICPRPRKLAQKPQGEDIQLLFRHQSAIVRNVELFFKNALQEFKEEVVPIERRLGRDLKTVTSNSKVFVFVDGYLGFNEVTAISRLAPMQDGRIICGSHLIVTPRDYLGEIFEVKLDQ